MMLSGIEHGHGAKLTFMASIHLFARALFTSTNRTTSFAYAATTTSSKRSLLPDRQGKASAATIKSGTTHHSSQPSCLGDQGRTRRATLSYTTTERGSAQYCNRAQ
ncbi:hypothetical protein JHK85_004821 [Glycine max]|nr:hypothetical protein JHK85_004821 [Glycine max]